MGRCLPYLLNGPDSLKNADTFSSLHPVVNFIYFGMVLIFSIAFLHPVCLAISLGSSFAYSIYLNGRKAAKFDFLGLLPLMALAALINPAFSHRGETILTYLPSGNPLTLESIAYGFAAAAMLASVVCWFSCYNTVMTSDKFIYLFGRIIPALSLLLSMSLRFIPKFKAQIREVSHAQKCAGRDAGTGNILQRAKNGLTILSIVITWSMENAIETADSMKSRGYGLSGRTAFSIYFFEKRDRNVLIFLLLCGGYLIAGACTKRLFWRYYPTMEGKTFGAGTVSLFAVYLALCLLPVILDREEDRKWTRLQSAI